MKKFVLCALALLVSLGGLLVPTVPVGAAAPDPYATISLTKIYDGTDHNAADGNKPNGTFVNSANGYIPGDDSATDGIVSSSDIVGYELLVNILPGPARSMDVALILPEGLTFSRADNADICVKNQFVTGRFNGTDAKPSCRYTAKVGTPVQVSSQVKLRGIDTGGTVLPGQVAAATIGAVGPVNGENAFLGVYTKALADPATVVSAPAADLVVRPSQCTPDYVCQRNTVASKAGSFFLTPQAVRWGGYSTTKGAAAGGSWSAQVDVSGFPEGTSWRYAGQELTVNDGVLTLPPMSGEQKLDFTLPTSINDWEHDRRELLMIHVMVDSTSFASEDFQNFMDGWQPGSDAGSSVKTSDIRGTGARAGYRVPNNDFGTWDIYQLAGQQGTPVFGKGIVRPWTSDATYWEPGRTSFDAGSEKSVRHLDPPSLFVTEGTELRVTLSADTTRFGVNTPTDFVLSDEWNPDEQVAVGPPVVSYGGRSVSAHVVQWSRASHGNNTADPDITDGWVTSNEPMPGARAMRVIFPGFPAGTMNGAGTYTVTVPMQIVDDWGDAGEKGRNLVDTMRGWVRGGPQESGNKWVTALNKPVAEAELTVEAPEINQDARQIRWVVTPSIRNLISTTDKVNGEATLNIDACATSFDLPADSQWMIQGAFVPGSGCDGDTKVPGKVTLVLKDPDGTLPLMSQDKTVAIGALPPIEFVTHISALGGGDVTVSGEFMATAAGTQEISEGTSVASAQASMAKIEAMTTLLKTLTPKVEIGDTIGWRAIVSAQDSGGAGGSAGLASQTVLVLPGRGDDDEYMGTLPNADVYDGPTKSSFDAPYSLTGAQVITTDSDAGATIVCTTDNNPSLDPTVNTWDAECSDAPGRRITAIKVVNQTPKLGITTVDITITSENSVRGEVYLMWIGDIYTAAGPAARGWPMPATIVASSITGKAYWDTTGKGRDYSDGAPVQAGIVVDLLDADRQKIASTTTTADGSYTFANLHSGTYFTRIEPQGGPGGFPNTVASEFDTNKTVSVNPAFTFAGQRLAKASRESSEISLGADVIRANVNFGYSASDPYSDVSKSAAKVVCPESDVVCDVSWDVTVKNGSDANPRGATNLTGGKLIDSTSSQVYDLKAGAFEDPRDKIKMIAAQGRLPRAVMVNPDASNGSAVATNKGYFFVSNYGVATKVDVPGDIIAITGLNPTGLGAGVGTTDGYFLVKPDGTVTQVAGISGTIIDVIGNDPLGATGSAVATTEGYWIVKNDGTATKVAGVSGSILALTGSSPANASSGVATTEGYRQVNANGTVGPLFPVDGRIIKLIGSVPSASSGVGILTAQGYWVYKTGDTEPVQIDLDTAGEKLVDAASINPATARRGAMVCAETKCFTVVPQANGSSVVTHFGGFKGTVQAIMGEQPAMTTGSSLLVTSEEYWILRGGTLRTKVSGITGKYVDITAAQPNVASSGAGIATTDGYWLVNSFGDSFKVDFPVDLVPNGAVSEVVNGDFIDRTYAVPDLAAGEAYKVRLSGKVNRSSAGFVVGNQAMATFSETPRDLPDQMTLPAYDATKEWDFGKRAGNATCTAPTETWVTPGDQCEQVYSQIEPTDQPLGTLSGNVWVDSEGKPALADGTPVRNARATLYMEVADAAPLVAGTAPTKADGSYEFKDLVAGNYFVTFTVDKDPVAGDGSKVLGQGQSWAWSPDAVAVATAGRSIADESGKTVSVALPEGGSVENVNGAIRVHNVAIEVTKEGSVAGGTPSSELTAEYDQEITVQASVKNTAADPQDKLAQLTFTDTVTEGPKVEWATCSFEGDNVDVSGTQWTDDTFVVTLPEAWVLERGEEYTCTGTIPALGKSAQEAQVHTDTVTATGVGTLTDVKVSDDSTFEATSNPWVRPVPAITLEKGILEPGGDPLTAPIATDAALDPGEEATITFRMTNTGEEDLLDVAIDDVTSKGPEITDLTCPFETTVVNGVQRRHLAQGAVLVCTAKLTIDDGHAWHRNDATVWAVGAESQHLANAEAGFDAHTGIWLPFSGGTGSWVYTAIAVVFAGLAIALVVVRMKGGRAPRAIHERKA
ncbi:MAG: SdrD B-like domain-containing protein [Ancrocorticia sp.]